MVDVEQIESEGEETRKHCGMHNEINENRTYQGGIFGVIKKICLRGVA